MLWPKKARWGQRNTKPAVYCLQNTCTPRIHTVHSPAIRVHDRQHDAEVQNIHLIQNSRSVGAAALLGGVGRHRARLEISERLLRRPPGTGGARMRLCRARQSESGGEIVAWARRVSSVQTRQRGLEMRADGAVVSSLRSGPQLLVLLLQFSHQFLELQHLQLRVADFTVTTDVCHHLGAQHLCFHLVTRTLRGGAERARPVCGGSCFCWKEGSGLKPWGDAATLMMLLLLPDDAQLAPYWSAGWSSAPITPPSRKSVWQTDTFAAVGAFMPWFWQFDIKMEHVR